MIPRNINTHHVLKAIRIIDSTGIPPGRESKFFKLLYKGKHYPPKYIVSVANKYANGAELKSSEFSGGKETNAFLVNLGFEIITMKNRKIDSTSKSDKRAAKESSKPHDERCLECKIAIEKMLKEIYGDVERNYKFDLGTGIEYYESFSCFKSLKDIFQKLQELRGHAHFIKTSTLPNCDYYVPEPGFLVEFDESQHFTIPRMISLQHYPQNLKLGFPKKRWIDLCEMIRARDNDPPYRDEQRAWYDSLRDFLPEIKGLNPTVRLYSKDREWCRFNSKSQSDLSKFKAIIRCRKPDMKIDIYDRYSKPLLARIVIAGEWEGNLRNAKELLEKICDNWPQDKRVNFLITCGAFLTFDWPNYLTEADIGNNIFPNSETVACLLSEAENKCDLLIDEGIKEKLLAHTDFITIGIDSYKEKISLSNVSIRNPHIELVAIVDLKKRLYHWTGKSYPTSGQEGGLVRIKELKTHFLELPLGKVMVLGCHDMSVFNRRGKSTTKKTWRKKIRARFYSLVKHEKPEIVLHHPHTTDSSSTWIASWGELKRKAPTIKIYGSAGRYYNQNGERSKIEEVLEKTKLGDTIDFVVQT